MTDDEALEFARDIAAAQKRERAILFEPFGHIWGAGRMALFPTKSRRLIPKKSEVRNGTKQ